MGHSVVEVSTRRAPGTRRVRQRLALGVTPLWIVVEALRRRQNQPDVHRGWMLAVATVGLGVNLLIRVGLSRGEHHGANNVPRRCTSSPTPASVAASVLAGALQMLWAWAGAPTRSSPW